MQKSSRSQERYASTRRSRHRAGLPVVSQPYYPDVQSDSVQNFFKALLLLPLPLVWIVYGLSPTLSPLGHDISRPIHARTVFTTVEPGPQVGKKAGIV